LSTKKYCKIKQCSSTDCDTIFIVEGPNHKFCEKCSHERKLDTDVKAARRYRKRYKGIPKLNQTNELGSKYTYNSVHRLPDFEDEYKAIQNMKKNLHLPQNNITFKPGVA
jgi:hypothetical protein